jgi:Na+-transporting NADH:ubiquinone oxidoreductase subunit NqrF
MDGNKRGTIHGGSRGPHLRKVKIRATPGHTGNTIMSDKGQRHAKGGVRLEGQNNETSKQKSVNVNEIHYVVHKYNTTKQ